MSTELDCSLVRFILAKRLELWKSATPKSAVNLLTDLLSRRDRTITEKKLPSRLMAHLTMAGYLTETDINALETMHQQWCGRKE